MSKIINKILNNDKIFHNHIYHGVYLGYVLCGIFFLISMYFLFENGPLFFAINIIILLLTNTVVYFFKEALKILLKDVISVFNVIFLVLSFIILTFIEISSNIHYLLLSFIFYWILDFCITCQINGKEIKRNIEKSSSDQGFDYMLKEDLRRNTYINFSITHKTTVLLFIFCLFYIFIGDFFIYSLFPSLSEHDNSNFLSISIIVYLIPLLMALVSFFNLTLLYFIEFFLLINYKNK